MSDEVAIGRGGQPAKLLLETKSGWSGEQLDQSRETNEKIAKHVHMALEIAEVPKAKKVFAAAHRIMRVHQRRMEVFNSPRVSRDKNANGIGRFATTLQRRSAKMAAQLELALKDEAMSAMASLSASDLRAHVTAAHASLTAIDDLIERAMNDMVRDAVLPAQSPAEIRIATGKELKELARAHGLPKMMQFVRAFGIHPRASASDEAFSKWFQRLND